jgi:hypothetical protein
MQAAIEAGLSIEVETFQFGSFIDAGTAAGFAAAALRYGEHGLEPGPTQPLSRNRRLTAVFHPTSARITKGAR